MAKKEVSRPKHPPAGNSLQRKQKKLRHSRPALAEAVLALQAPEVVNQPLAPKVPCGPYQPVVQPVTPQETSNYIRPPSLY